MLPPPLQQIDRTCVLHAGKKLTYFGGCDYFRLASHPAVLRALREGSKKYGLNVAASRMTTGNHRLYEALERELVEFFGAPSALLMASGYLANLAVAQALAGHFSHAIFDAEAHASLLDAALFLDCPLLKFKHRDISDLARTLQRCGRDAKVVLLTDGLFAQDGSVAPLKACLEILPEDAVIVVDDAHGAGVLGETGKGTLEANGIGRRRVIQTITLSKAFGVYGGAVLETRSLVQRIQTRSRLFAGATPLPLPLANAALQALKILRHDGSLRARLLANIDFCNQSLSAIGGALADARSPIIAIVPRNAGESSRLRRQLLAQNIYPSCIRYPSGPPGGYFRFAISSEHSRQQLEGLTKALAQFQRFRSGLASPSGRSASP